MFFNIFINGKVVYRVLIGIFLLYMVEEVGLEIVGKKIKWFCYLVFSYMINLE